MNLIDKEDWMSLPVDVKGTIYEELLRRSASESTKGAGQYFTTRAVIQTMVEVMQPTPQDSAGGTRRSHGAIPEGRPHVRHEPLPARHRRRESRGALGARQPRRPVELDKKEGRSRPWTEKLWVYDLRTYKHFTQKQSPITRRDFDEFVACFRPGARHKRKPTWSEERPDGRWRDYTYEEILKRDKLSLDLFWIKDRSLTDTESLPPPDVLAAEIADELEAAFGLFSKVAAKLPKSVTKQS